MVTPLDFFRALPELETERLRLRALNPEDGEALFEWGRDPEMTRYATQVPLADRSEARRLIELFERRAALGQPRPWGIFWVDAHAPDERPLLVGTCGFGTVHGEYGCADLGFQVARSHWGRGVATEAARAALAAAFGPLELHRVEANCAVENHASARVLEKLGMRVEGVLRERMRVAGRYLDMKLYAILAPEFRAGADASGPATS